MSACIRSIMRSIKSHLSFSDISRSPIPDRASSSAAHTSESGQSNNFDRQEITHRLATVLTGIYAQGYEYDVLHDILAPSTTVPGDEWNKAKRLYDEGHALVTSTVRGGLSDQTDEVRNWATRAEAYLSTDQAVEAAESGGGKGMLVGWTKAMGWTS